MKNNRDIKKSLFLSAVSLLLCVVMLVGMTFAWFTDSVTNSNNKITAGNLDAQLMYSKDGTTWNEVKSDTKIFDDNAVWEPGYTEVVYLKVKNAGNLALKYKLGINIAQETAGTNVNGETFKLSDYIKFGVKETDTAYNDRQSAVNAVEADSVLLSQGYAGGEEKLQKDEDSGMIALVVYMPENVGNVANHNGENAPSIDLGVSMVATQFDSERDSFGSDYDKDAKYPVLVDSSDELTAAVAAGKDVKLTENIEIEKALTISKKDISIDLNEKELSSSTDNVKLIQAIDSGQVRVFGGKLKVKTAVKSDTAAVYAQGNSDVVIENCKISIENSKGYAVVTNGSNSKNTSITMKNTDIVYKQGYACYFPAGNITLENCNVTGAVIISGGNVTIDGGTYKADGFPGQAKIWHKDDTIKYMNRFSSSDGCGHMGDSILIMDRRSSGYNLQGVTIKNVTFNTSLVMSGGGSATAYAVKYVDYNNIPGKDRVVPVMENNTYNHKLESGKDPLMFIGIDDTEY